MGEGSDNGFYPGVFGHQPGKKVQLYPALTLAEDNGYGQQQPVMLTADEKVNELNQLLE